MNDEIKECIEGLLEVACCPWHQESCKKVYDYITNLQQDYDNEAEENLKLSKWLVEKQQRIEGLEAENETLRSDFKNQVEYTNKIAEENERLKEIWKDTIVFSKEYETIVMNTNGYKVYNDYKSRCEKAIEYINKNKDLAGWVHCLDEDLLNILQNGSEDNE